MNPWANDLQYAQQAGVAVDVGMFDGQRFQTGVADGDEEAGLFSLYTPQTLGDTTTRVRLKLDGVTSLAVTDIQWGPQEKVRSHKRRGLRVPASRAVWPVCHR